MTATRFHLAPLILLSAFGLAGKARAAPVPPRTVELGRLARKLEVGLEGMYAVADIEPSRLRSLRKLEPRATVPIGEHASATLQIPLLHGDAGGIDTAGPSAWARGNLTMDVRAFGPWRAGVVGAGLGLSIPTAHEHDPPESVADLCAAVLLTESYRCVPSRTTLRMHLDGGRALGPFWLQAQAGVDLFHVGEAREWGSALRGGLHAAAQLTPRMAALLEYRFLLELEERDPDRDLASTIDLVLRAYGDHVDFDVRLFAPLVRPSYTALALAFSVVYRFGAGAPPAAPAR